jgi:hypothetical protein
LGTEKVGLPIEKQLTVKNEGTVAVSLTLSTAAPYKIVSVPPTLSPGQSAQVTLRFDPTESGSFSGNVQVGINGGQGSVTAPLVGTAHKIEVSPPQIGFGLLLLSDSSEPTYKEQQLTVKNQGVTTVSVTASVSEPFRITTGNSFALAPAASSEVTVRFDPPAPGEFQGAVKLTVGQLTIEIPAKASAMNEQDFLQMLAELSQIRELDTVIPVINDLIDILKKFREYPWFYKGSQLWEQLAEALLILGSRALAPGSPSVESKFKETLMALVIAANMARDGGWEVYAFRRNIKFGESIIFGKDTFVDVAAAITLSTGRKVNVFAQFFHAVTGYNYNSLANLVEFVIKYATNQFIGGRVGVLQKFGLDPDSARRIANYRPGIVVAVNKADTDSAVSTITAGINRCDSCFFGVVIEIDPDKEEVIRIIGIGISEDEAKEIAARMGITVGSKWSLEQLIMYLMGMFMK